MIGMRCPLAAMGFLAVFSISLRFHSRLPVASVVLSDHQFWSDHLLRVGSIPIDCNVRRCCYNAFCHSKNRDLDIHGDQQSLQ